MVYRSKNDVTFTATSIYDYICMFVLCLLEMQIRTVYTYMGTMYRTPFPVHFRLDVCKHAMQGVKSAIQLGPIKVTQ